MSSAEKRESIEPVLILGGGGHAKVLIETIRLTAPSVRLAIVDTELPVNSSVLEVPVIGADDVLGRAASEGFRRFVVGLGGVRDNNPRARLYEAARAVGLAPQPVLHPSAIIAGSARLGAGVQCLPAAVIGSDAVLGDNVIVNTGAIIEHDCRIGDHVHIASGAVIASTVEVGDFAHVGAGALVLQLRKIGRYAVVGGGAVVTRSAAAGAIVFGVPAREVALADISGRNESSAG